MDDVPTLPTFVLLVDVDVDVALLVVVLWEVRTRMIRWRIKFSCCFSLDVAFRRLLLSRFRFLRASFLLCPLWASSADGTGDWEGLSLYLLSPWWVAVQPTTRSTSHSREDWEHFFFRIRSQIRCVWLKYYYSLQTTS